MVKNIQALVLAAGKSRSISTNTTKLVHKLCGQEMVLYPLTLLQELAIPATVVVGYQKERVEELCCRYKDVTCVHQPEQHGTAHAVACAQSSLNADTILIMNGDTPLVSKEIIEELIQTHEKKSATLSFVLAHTTGPAGSSYGRFVEDDNGMRVVAESSLEGNLHDHCLIDAGIYLVQKDFLVSALPNLKPCLANNEMCLSELIALAYQSKAVIATTHAPFDRIRSIDTLQDLWAAEHIKRSDLIRSWMSKGVRFSMPQTVHLDLGVTIGQDTVIGAGVHLMGSTTIGRNCTIREYSVLENATLEDNVTILPHSVITNSSIATQSNVGPFAHLREHTHLDAGCSIGNFVEIKKSTLGATTKARHLSYLGDATIGSGVNIGAGTITCNHDGVRKHPTTINDNAYVGTNNSLVAPVTIGKGAFTAAGSVITEDVPDNGLAIGRARQVTKPEYASIIRARAAAGQPKKKASTEQTDSFIGAIKTKDSSQNHEGL